MWKKYYLSFFFSYGNIHHFSFMKIFVWIFMMMNNRWKIDLIKIMFTLSYPCVYHKWNATCEKTNHKSLVTVVVITMSGRCIVSHSIEEEAFAEAATLSLSWKMASSVMASVALKPAPFTVEKSSVRGLPSLSRNSSSFRVVASGGKKIKTDKPYGLISCLPFWKHWKINTPFC